MTKIICYQYTAFIQNNHLLSTNFGKNPFSLDFYAHYAHIIVRRFFMLFVYPAIFHKEAESYWVEFPDLKGCNTYGSTIPEAMEMAQEALLSKIQT